MALKSNAEYRQGGIMISGRLCAAAAAAVVTGTLVANTADAAAMNLLTNPGFEDGLAGWDSSTALLISDPSFAYEGNNAVGVNGLSGAEADGSIRQTIAITEAGDYEFGAFFFVQTDDPAGNFDQLQMSMFASGTGVIDTTVGTQPADLSFSPGPFLFLDSGWFLVSGSFSYDGSGGAENTIVNINVQNFSPNQTALFADAAYVHKAPAPVPLPAAGWLMVAGLGGLGVLRRKRA